MQYLPQPYLGYICDQYKQVVGSTHEVIEICFRIELIQSYTDLVKEMLSSEVLFYK